MEGIFLPGKLNMFCCMLRSPILIMLYKYSKTMFPYLDKTFVVWGLLLSIFISFWQFWASFSYKLLSYKISYREGNCNLGESIITNQLTHIMPLVSFCTHWKHQKKKPVAWNELNGYLRILTGKKHLKIKLQRLQKIRI